MLIFMLVVVVLCVAVLWVLRDRRTATGVPLVLVMAALALLTIWGYGRKPTYIPLGSEPIDAHHAQVLVVSGIDVSHYGSRRPTLVTNRASDLDILLGNPFMPLYTRTLDFPYKDTSEVSHGRDSRDLHGPAADAVHQPRGAGPGDAVRGLRPGQGEGPGAVPGGR